MYKYAKALKYPNMMVLRYSNGWELLLRRLGEMLAVFKMTSIEFQMQIRHHAAAIEHGGHIFSLSLTDELKGDENRENSHLFFIPCFFYFFRKSIEENKIVLFFIFCFLIFDSQYSKKRKLFGAILHIL